LASVVAEGLARPGPRFVALPPSSTTRLAAEGASIAR